MKRGSSSEFSTPKIQLFNPNVVKVEKIMQRVHSTLTNYLLPSVQTDFISTTYTQLIETIPSNEDEEQTWDLFWESWVPFREDAIEVCSQSVIDYSHDYVAECFTEIKEILNDISKMSVEGIALKRSILENIEKISKLTSNIESTLNAQYTSGADEKQKMKNLLMQRTKIRHYKTDITTGYTQFFESIQKAESQKRIIEITDNIFKNINNLPEQQKYMTNIKSDLSIAEKQLYQLYKPKSAKIELLQVKTLTKISASNPIIMLDEEMSEDDESSGEIIYNTTEIPDRIGKTKNFMSDSDSDQEDNGQPKSTPIKMKTSRKHFGTDDYNVIKLGINQSPKPSPHLDSENEYEMEEEIIEEEHLLKTTESVESKQVPLIESLPSKDEIEIHTDIFEDSENDSDNNASDSPDDDHPPYIPPVLTPDILRKKPRQAKMAKTPQPQDSIQPLDLSQEDVNFTLELSDDDEDFEQKISSNHVSHKYARNINLGHKAITPNVNRSKMRPKIPKIPPKEKLSEEEEKITTREIEAKVLSKQNFEIDEIKVSKLSDSEEEEDPEKQEQETPEQIIERLKQEIAQKDDDYETLRIQLEVSFEENRELQEQNKKLKAKVLSKQNFEIDPIKVPKGSDSEEEDEISIEEELRTKVDSLEKERLELLKNIEQITEENEKLQTLTQQMQENDSENAQEKDKIRLYEEMQQILLAEVTRCRKGQDSNIADILSVLASTREELLSLKAQKVKLLNDKGVKNVDILLQENQKLIDENSELRRKLGATKLQIGKNPGSFETLRRSLLSSMLNEANLRMQMQLMALSQLDQTPDVNELKQNLIAWGNQQQKAALEESARADINEKKIRDIKEKLNEIAKSKNIDVANMDVLEMIDLISK